MCVCARTAGDVFFKHKSKRTVIFRKPTYKFGSQPIQEETKNTNLKNPCPFQNCPFALGCIIIEQNKVINIPAQNLGEIIKTPGYCEVFCIKVHKGRLKSIKWRVELNDPDSVETSKKYESF